MRNSPGPKGKLLLFACVLIGLSSRFVFADGEPAPLENSDGKVSFSDSKVVPTEELGVGNYSKFPFRVSVSVRGGYDDNVNTSHSHEDESVFTNASALVNYDFGSARTQLSLQVGGGITYYWDHNDNVIGSDDNDDFDENVYASLSLQHKFSPRLTLNVTAYATYQSEPDFTLALGVNRRSGNYFYTQDKSTLTYLWTPRFATATSYTLGVVQYDDSSVGLFEDRIENTFGNEFKFLLWPTTSLVAEYRFGLINYDHEGHASGPTVFLPATMSFFTPRIDRDSFTHYVLAGVDHSFSPRLSTSFRVGAEFRDYPDGQDDQSTSSPYYEGSTNYALGKDTMITLSGRYSIEEGDVLLNPARTTYRSGLRVTHNFTPRITGNLATYYAHDDYHSLFTPAVFSPSFEEDSFDVAISFRYAISRYFGLEAGFNHTDVDSDVSQREYSRNRYWGGLNFTF